MKELLNRMAESGIDMTKLLIGGAVILAAFLLISLVGKLLFGKRSLIFGSICATFCLLFVYATYVCVRAFHLPFFQVSLPLIDIADNKLTFFSFSDSIPAICTQVFHMFLLAFIAGIADHLIPKGKSILIWLMFRIITVVGVLLAYGAVSALISTVLAPKIIQYSSLILLGLLFLLLATGSLKFLVGLALSAVNPVIAALFSFFFLSMVGKQILKALLVSTLFIGIVLIFERLEITALAVASGVLIAYTPMLLIAVCLWYFMGKRM